MPEVLIIIGVVVLLVALLLIKKIASVVRWILFAVIVVAGVISVIIFVPSSPISIWVTENVSSKITLDSENKYKDGELLFTYEFNPTKSEDKETSQGNLLTSSLHNISASLNKFLAGRIEAIASKYIEKQEKYTLSFSDSYLIMTPGELSMKIEIIKGSLSEEQ